ncbi:MAG: alpha/beta hydrolase [Anaerolineales bacterium]|nr:alpha/beta hydrolase [Anaerolineales bacterium]
MPFEFPVSGEVIHLTPDFRQSVRGSFIRLGDGITHYQLAGLDDMPVVVLVHGFSVPHFIWDPTFESLAAAGFRVLRYDLFGRGYSDRPHLRYDLDLFTRQLADLLDALEMDQCRAVFGLSMGGLVAANFAVRHRDRLEKLGLFAPAGFPLEIPSLMRLLLVPLVGEMVFGLVSEKLFERLVGKSIFEPAEVELVIERYRPQMRIKGFRRALLSTMRTGVAERGVPVYRELGRISDLPVFLIWGEEDTTVPYKFSKLFLSLVPHTEFHPISGGGHIPHYRQADQVTPMILGFLNG